MGLIEGLARGGGQVAIQTVEQGQQTVVLNLNLNVQSQEVHQVHQCDEVLKEKVEVLERQLREYQELLKYYKDSDRFYRDILRHIKLAAQQNDVRTIRQILSKVEHKVE
jgi:predicted patatin/cPLA2 family phospholipase